MSPSAPIAPANSAEWGRSQGRDRRLMGRRLYLLIGTTIAVAGIALAMPVASARADEPAPVPIPKGEGPYQVRWRNVRIRELKPGETAPSGN